MSSVSGEEFSSVEITLVSVRVCVSERDGAETD